MLAAAVDAGERLLVQQADKPVTGGDFLHQLHRELIVVGGDVRGRIDGGQLVLRGCGLVVLGLGEDAQLPQFLVQLGHKRLDARLDGAEVMILQFLPLRRLRAEQGAAGIDEVLAALIELFVYEKILLFGADGRIHALGVVPPEQAEDAERLLVERLHRAQQRRLFVQRLAAVGAEGGGNVQRFVLDEGIGGGVPRGVAPRLEGRAQAARREGGRVRLAFDQFLPREFHNHAAVRRGRDKAVVLLGRDAGKRLEPVGVMRGAVRDRPVLHRGGHRVGDAEVELRPLVNGLFQRLVYLGGQIGFHHPVVKHQTSEVCGYRFHSQLSFFHKIKAKTAFIHPAHERRLCLFYHYSVMDDALCSLLQDVLASNAVYYTPA